MIVMVMVMMVVMMVTMMIRRSKRWNRMSTTDEIKAGLKVLRNVGRRRKFIVRCGPI